MSTILAVTKILSSPLRLGLFEARAIGKSIKFRFSKSDEIIAAGRKVASTFSCVLLY